MTAYTHHRHTYFSYNDSPVAPWWELQCARALSEIFAVGPSDAAKQTRVRTRELQTEHPRLYAANILQHLVAEGVWTRDAVLIHCDPWAAEREPPQQD